MTKKGSAGIGLRSGLESLERWHRNRFGTSIYSEAVYGYWLFVAGISLVSLGFIIYIFNSVAENGGSVFWTARQTAAVLGAVGASLTLYVAVRQLPIERTSETTAATGAFFVFSVLFFLSFIIQPTGTSLPGTLLRTTQAGSQLYTLLGLCLSFYPLSFASGRRASQSRTPNHPRRKF